MSDQLNTFSDYTFVVAGDFNVGHSDSKKNGTSLLHDCYKRCDNNDGYDDTHALLETELVSGVEMTNLTLSHESTTYPKFPGSPIDNIYVQGPLSDKFSSAIIREETYGSDHLPVLVTVTITDAEKSFDNEIEAHALTGAVDDNLTGEPLRKHLRATWFKGKHTPLSYNEARIEMYSNIDRADDGYVYGVYSGYKKKAKPVTYLKPINAEHPVPQSWFSKKMPMKSDIHHLFSTHETTNNRRGSLPFGEVANASKWLGIADEKLVMVESLPTTNEHSYSELDVNTMFEPPENQKGNTARAIAYFYTMYAKKAGSINRIFYAKNIQLLADWHMMDPVDDAERERNERIKVVQGNGNPYIEHPELLCRAWEIENCQ